MEKNNFMTLINKALFIENIIAYQLRFVEQISGVRMGYIVLSLNNRNSMLHLSHVT